MRLVSHHSTDAKINVARNKRTTFKVRKMRPRGFWHCGLKSLHQSTQF